MFGADDQRLGRMPDRSIEVGDAQRVEKSGAHRVHVEGDAIVDPERRLDLGRR